MKTTEMLKRLKATERWQSIGIFVLLFCIIFGILFGIYQTQTLNESIFNEAIILGIWSAGITFYLICQAIHAICYRLDLIIDKK